MEYLYARSRFYLKKKVNLNFIFHPKNVQEIINILKVNAFKHPVWIDINDSFNKLNHYCPIKI